MSVVARISDRLRREFFRWRYSKAANEVFATRPLVVGEEPFMLLSMVHSRDVPSYVVAVKSFARYLNPHRIVVVCDPSISENDRSVLARQIPHVELRDADEFVDPLIPRGGCWERLYAITEYSRDNYVIQLDADTASVRDVSQVRSCVRAGTGFVLGEEAGQRLVTFREASDRALAFLKPGAHIQTRSEAALPELGLPEDSRYVRGCAGFTGFPASGDMRERMLDFSRRMQEKLGDAWRSWGTEQVTSNYLVANFAATSVLPFPEYGTPDQQTDATAFLHFIGSLRFIDSKYQRVTEEIIKSLAKGTEDGVD